MCRNVQKCVLCRACVLEPLLPYFLYKLLYIALLGIESKEKPLCYHQSNDSSVSTVSCAPTTIPCIWILGECNNRQQNSTVIQVNNIAHYSLIVITCFMNLYTKWRSALRMLAKEIFSLSQNQTLQFVVFPNCTLTSQIYPTRPSAHQDHECSPVLCGIRLICVYPQGCKLFHFSLWHSKKHSPNSLQPRTNQSAGVCLQLPNQGGFKVWAKMLLFIYFPSILTVEKDPFVNSLGIVL